MQIPSRALFFAVLAIGLGTACNRQSSTAPAPEASSEPAATATESAESAPGTTTNFEQQQTTAQQPAQQNP